MVRFEGDLTINHTTYLVRVPGFKLYPTGGLQGSAVREILVEEEYSVAGSLRAIDKAYERATTADFTPNQDASAEITPNYPELLDPRRPAFSGPGRQQLVQRKGMDVLVARLGAMVAGEWDRGAWKPVIMSARRLGLPGVYEAAQERRRRAQGFA